MLSVILSWIYILLICVPIGLGTLCLLEHKAFSLSSCIMTGIVAITVYAEFASIFVKIGCFTHMALLLAALVSGYINRKEIRLLWRRIQSQMAAWLFPAHDDRITGNMYVPVRVSWTDRF